MICPKCKSTRIRKVFEYPKLTRAMSTLMKTKPPRTPCICKDCNFPFLYP